MRIDLGSGLDAAVLGGDKHVRVGNIRMSMAVFCTLAEHVLLSARSVPANDPRLVLVDRIRQFMEVPAENMIGTRLIAAE